MDALLMRYHMKELDQLPVDSVDRLDSTLGQVTLYWNWLLKRTIPIVNELLHRFPVAKLELERTDSGRGAAEAVLARRLSRWLEPAAEPFSNEMTSNRARLVASLLPALTQLGPKATRDFVRLIQDVNIDDDLLIQLKQQEKLDQDKQADELLSLLDHLVLLQHFSAQQQQTGRLTLSVATTSAAQLDLAGHDRPWAESLLAHWEVVNRLELAASPLLSRTAASLLIDGLVTLAESEEKHGRLVTLHKILWLNADHIQLAAYDPLVNDHRLAVESLDNLVCGVAHALQKPKDIDAWKATGVNSKAVEIVKMAQGISNDEDKLGSLWVLQGLARCLFLVTLPGSRVDPVVKRTLKSHLKRHELERLERLLGLYRSHRRVLLAEPHETLDDATTHPHIRHLANVEQRLDVQLKAEGQRKPTWRPESSLFDHLMRDLHHFVSSVASPVSVLALNDKLTSSKVMK